MIYLIKCSYYDFSIDTPCTLLKIGYSEDNDETWKRRLDTYYLHNPLCELVMIIPGATKEHESRLHYKFRHLLSYRREWFKESEEILDFFSTATLETLSQLPVHPNSLIVKNNSLLRDRKIHTLLDYVLREEGRKDITTEDLKEMLKVVSYDSTTPEKIFEDLKRSNHYPSLSSKTWKEVECFLFPPLPEDVRKFFEKYDKLKTYVEKIKYIVDGILDNPSYEDAIIGNLVDSDKIKQQLVTLGAARIKSLSYNLTYINKAMGITIFDKKSFLAEIEKEFKVGQRYTKKYIKAKLGDIYKAADFKETPKANDLEEWFEIKLCKTQDPTTGKLENGFELLRRKP